jgi:protein-S-isoprenylcysteine O-methyltransferase
MAARAAQIPASALGDCPPYVHDPPTLNGISSSSSSSRWDPSRNTTMSHSSASSPGTSSPSASDIISLAPFFPHGDKSLAGIAVRAFCLGASLMFSILTVFYILALAPSSHPIWRAPFFLGALSVFHFLEFWVTAQRNTTVANIDSFLLTQNWPSYAIAHSLAFIETIVVSIFFPNRNWSLLSIPPSVFIIAGLVLTLMGQFVRTLAMYQAGASFNHQVQQRRAATHTLVTHGVYSFVRHPGYFGFFWWGLGTQLVLGNVGCFFAYAAVLWYFFNDRIEHEEDKLVDFFKEDYQKYRKRVPTRIPFIS